MVVALGLVGAGGGAGGMQSLPVDVAMKAFTKGLGVKPLKAPAELQKYVLGGAVF